MKRLLLVALLLCGSVQAEPTEQQQAEAVCSPGARDLFVSVYYSWAAKKPRKEVETAMEKAIVENSDNVYTQYMAREVVSDVIDRVYTFHQYPTEENQQWVVLECYKHVQEIMQKNHTELKGVKWQ